MQTSVRRNLAWMGLSQGGLVVLQFGSSVVMARLLTPREMGVYAVAVAVIGLLNMIRSFGLNSLVIREPELTQPLLRTIFTVNAGLALLCSLLILAVSRLGGEAFGDAGVERVLQLLAIGPVINMLEFMPSVRLERDGEFRVVASVNLLKVVTNAAVTIGLASLGYSYMSIAWGNVVTSSVGMLCYNAVGWRFVTVAPGLQDWRRIGRFGLQMMALSAVGSVTSRLTDLLIGRLIGLSALGLYSRASGLNSLLWDNLHVVIGRVVFVDFAEQVRRGLSLRSSYMRIVAMLTAALWPAFAGLGILAGPVVMTIYGQTWLPAALPLSLLCVAGIVLVGITMTGEIYLVTAQIRSQIRFELKRNVTGVALFALGCLGGLAWAAASRIGDALAAVVFARGDLNRMTGTTSADFRPIYVQSAALTLLACGPVALLMAANDWSERTSLLSIFAAAGLGVLAWAGGLFVGKHPLYFEVKRLAGSVFKRVAVATLQDDRR